MNTAALIQEATKHHRAGRFHEAEVIYRRVLAAEPNNPDAWHLLGMIANQAKHNDEAVAMIRHAISLAPRNAVYYNNLGTVYEEEEEHEQAAAAFREAIRLSPRYPSPHGNLGEVFKAQGRLADALAGYRAALACDPNVLTVRSNLLMVLNYDPQLSAEDILREHVRWGDLPCDPAVKLPPPGNDRDPKRPLRVGYVSPDFRKHAVARFFEPILANHDHRQFQVFLYAEVPGTDATAERFERLADGWRRTVGHTAAAVAKMIRADKIDILVDLAGHTRHNRLDAFVYRPAPIQATYLGYPGTTGVPGVDVRLSDAVLDPPDRPAHTSERLVRLPGGFCCFEPPSEAPEVSELPALQTGRVTFGIYHPPIKLNEPLFQLWRDVLEAVPDSRLLMFRNCWKPTLAAEMLRRMIGQGIDRRRVVFKRPTADEESYLGLFDEVDIALDCGPFCGHTMTCESLWMGVPVVTLLGGRACGRLSASVLTNLQLTDLIAATPQEYVRAAAALAGDLGRLAEVRRTLRARMRSGLGDGPAFTRRLEGVYRELWKEWAGRPDGNPVRPRK